MDREVPAFLRLKELKKEKERFNKEFEKRNDKNNIEIPTFIRWK